MQYELSEHHWHCPILFSFFGPKLFCKILTAVLLEKSLIFVHDNLTVVSSVICALKTLIRPFRWSYLIAPVLPNCLLESIESPQSVLVGITSRDYQ